MHKPLSVSRAEPMETEESGAAAGDGAPPGGAPAPPLRKRDIPTPVIATVEGYETEQKGGYKVPDGYIRFPRRAAGEDDVASCEYCLEMEDEEWLDAHPKYGKSASEAEREKIGVDRLERMLGILECATGQADPVPIQQAETLFVSKLGMNKTQHHGAWAEVYKYWKEKRARLGKPLLRRFWPVTSPSDTDPHKVFRPREKERYKLRKHRKNDLDSFRKLQQVKKDFEKLLNITRMIQKREVMKREQLLVQQEIFMQQHWDLTDTTGEARPLNVQPGTYRARPRQPAAAAAVAAAASASGGPAGPAGGSGGTAPIVPQPFERPRDDNPATKKSSASSNRDRPSTRPKKRKNRQSSSHREGGGAVPAAGAAGGDGTGATSAGAAGYGDEEEEGDDGGAEGGGAGAAGGDDAHATVGGVIPGSHISILPSFMDELKTRASMPVRSVVEPALAVYCVRGGRVGRGGARAAGGKKGGSSSSSSRGGGGGGKSGSASGSNKKEELGGVGVEPVYKFRLRGRIGRGGRVMWDRVPVEAPPPARDDGLADPDDAPHIVHSNYVRFPFKPPSACVLHPPMVNLNADERRYREICAMDDDQEELLEPLGLGLMGGDSSNPGSNSSSDPMSGGGRRDSGSAPKVKYAIEV